MKDQYFFYAKYDPGQIKTKGIHSHLFGHKIDRGSGNSPDGVFAEWLWDGQKLVVNNDRYGLFPLYYCCHNNEIYLSPTIRQLLFLGAPKEFDYDALAVFLRLGLYIGDSTSFQNIKVLPPGSSFIWENGVLKVSRHYPTSKQAVISENDAIDGFIQLFRQAMKRRLPEDRDFILTLSGGRDSRHILLELDHLGYKPKSTITLRPYPPYYDEDIRIAKMLSEALNIKHITLEQKKSYFDEEVRALEITNYGSDEHAWFMALANHLKDKTKVFYDGIAGDILSGGSEHMRAQALLAAFQAKNKAEICKKLFETWGRPDDYILRWVMDNGFLEKVNRDRAIEYLSKELDKHLITNNPIRSFYFWNRTIRKIGLSPYAINSGIDKVYSPYLDHELYDFLTSLPTDMINKGILHSQVIERAYPQYARIPYEQNELKRINVTKHKVRFSKDFAWNCIQSNILSSKLVNGKYLLPRLLRCFFDKKYCESMWWYKPPVLLYLRQLEMLQKERRAYA